MTVVETQNLGKTYKNGVEGLTGLTVSIGKGRIFGLLGPNGSGKTTTVRCLNGTLTPTTGTYRVLGDQRDSEDLRRRTATLSESAAMYANLSVAENLMFFGTLYGLQKDDIQGRINELLSRLGLAEKAALKLGSFSTGMKKRVQLARTILHRPELVFLDEPTSGLDPEASLEVIQLIQSLARDEGMTVLLCTHNLPLAERICDDYGFLAEGRLVYTGTRDETLGAGTGARILEVGWKKDSRSPLEVETFRFEDETKIGGLVRSVLDDGKVLVSVNERKRSLEDAYLDIVSNGRHRGEV